MRQRYVVQVLDDDFATAKPAKSNQTTPPAQPRHQPDVEVLPLEPGSKPWSREPRWRTEVIDTSASRNIDPQAFSEPPKPATAPPHAEFQQKTSKSAPAPSVPVNPDDYWQRRQQEIQRLWRQAGLQEGLQKAAAEQPAVELPKQPKTGSSAEGQISAVQKKEATLQQQSAVNTAPASPSTGETNSLSKIESFYQRQSSILPADTSQKPWERWLEAWRIRWQQQRRLAATILAAAVIGFSAWLGWMGIQLEIQGTASQAESLISDIENSQLVSAQERLLILEEKQAQYQKWYHLARPVVRLTQGKEKTNHLDRLFTVSQQGLEIVDSGLDLYTGLDTAYQQFVGEQEGGSVETFSQVSGDLEALFTQLSALQAELQQLGNPYHIEVITKLQKELGGELPDLRRHVLAAQKMSQVLPEILGENERKTYLVLLQNNAELRPTGGFIGSFALVNIEKGKLLEFKVEDVYEADGQLNGFVTPPEEIVTYLNEEQWFLRDVNWSPDFPEVAQRASWFLDKSLQVQPDGVIGMNLDVVQRFLDVTGPLELVDYDTVVTADTLYKQAEHHSEINFFPGSNGKKDFLSAVASRLMDELFYQPSNKIELARVVLDSAEEAELLISLQNPQAEAVLADLGWNGDVRTPDCPPLLSNGGGTACEVDTVMQVEANVGVNKANQYVTRDITHTVELTADMARHTRKMVITNDSASEAWPAGRYKTYWRLYVTPGSQLRSVMLDNQPIDLAEFEVEEDAGKQVFGYYLEVPIQSSRTLEVFYETPLAVGQTLGAYALFEQKQPGTGSDGLKLVIEPGEIDIAAVAPEPEFVDNAMHFKTDRRTHQFVGVKLK